MTNTRYIDTATVSDEHGKGVEVLRQALLHTDGTENLAFIPEVDCLIRYVKAYRIGSGQSLVVQVSIRNSGETTTSNVSSAFTLNDANVPRYTPTDVPLTNGTPLELGRDQILELIIGGAHTNAMFIIGWMPNMFSLDANHRTYGLP